MAVKPVLPESYIEQDILHIYYRTKLNNVKKHVYINEEDEKYIYQTLGRLLAELCEKQYIQKDWWREMIKKDTQFSISAYSKSIKPAPNSIVSYTAGLLSNKYRNQDQDFTVKQLDKVEVLHTIAHNLYKSGMCEIGHRLSTGEQNELPKKIKFCEA